jgi:hypothetical protein
LCSKQCRARARIIGRKTTTIETSSLETQTRTTKIKGTTIKGIIIRATNLEITRGNRIRDSQIRNSIINNNTTTCGQGRIISSPHTKMKAITTNTAIITDMFSNHNYPHNKPLIPHTSNKATTGMSNSIQISMKGMKEINMKGINISHRIGLSKIIETITEAKNIFNKGIILGEETTMIGGMTGTILVEGIITITEIVEIIAIRTGEISSLDNSPAKMGEKISEEITLNTKTISNTIIDSIVIDKAIDQQTPSNNLLKLTTITYHLTQSSKK